MPQSWDMEQIPFTSLPKEGMLTWSGFEPAKSGTRGQNANHQTTEAAMMRSYVIPMMLVVMKCQEGP
jgi:hypothetical protein